MDSTFDAKIAPYAIKAGRSLNMDPAVIMAQWLYETGNGTNAGATKYNNLAGIKSKANSAKGIYDPANSIHAGYTNLSAFTDDYIKVMNLSYYDSVRSTARVGASPLASLSAINSSPWAVADYNSSGWMNYYNQASKVLGSKSYSLTDDIGAIDTSGISDFLKANWWLIAGGLILIAVIR